MNPEFEAFMKSKNASIYTSEHPDYGYLHDGEFWVCFENPNDSQDVLVRSGKDGLLLFFDQWSQSYDNDPGGIAELIEQVESIMDDRAYIWKGKIGSRNFISLINDDPGVFYDLARNGFEGQVNGMPVTFNAENVEQSFVFWDPLMMEPEETYFMN